MTTFAATYSRCLRYGSEPPAAEEEAFHKSLIYHAAWGDHTPHLAYFDFLQDHGHDKLAEALRRGVQEQAAFNGGIHRGSNSLGLNYPATFAHLGSVGNLSLGMAKPIKDHVVLSATPQEAFTDEADSEGLPFHYRSVLDSGQAHDLADSLGDHPVGKELKQYLKAKFIKDTRKPEPPQ